MAKTYDDYQATDTEQARQAGEDLIERVSKAMDRTEILQDVRRRVTAFVEAYDEMFAPEVDHVKYVREAEDYDPQSRAARVADNLEMDLQTLRSAPASPDNVRLLLDDVKILLDQFPQKDV